MSPLTKKSVANEEQVSPMCRLRQKKSVALVRVQRLCFVESFFNGWVVRHQIKFHCSSLQKEITSNKTSGKKIDFMLQELFRETSTLSVKLDEPNYKKIALDMKLLVEEMREQAQNIE